MKKAFSLFEFALILSILFLIFSLLPFYPQNQHLIHLGAKQILNDLSYTRNLALIQENFRTKSLSLATKDEWFKARWQLYFIRSKIATNNELSYTIFLDKNGDGNANLGKSYANIDREIAVDIFNPKKFMSFGQSGVIQNKDLRTNQRFNIEKTYNITKVELKGSCSGSTRIIFDEFGRLYSPLKNAKHAYDKILIHKKTDCIIKLSNEKQAICIVVQNLTGYSFIPEFEATNTQYVHFNDLKLPCSKL